MNSSIFIVFLILTICLHQTNALLYKLQTNHHHQASSNNPLKDLMLVPTSSEIARQDLIYLFMTPPTNKFAHISMPALQILCYLRMAKIPYYLLSNQFLLASPTGKPQFAQINGKIFDDPQKIIEEIEKIEAEKNKKPQKIVEKSANEIKMEEALDTIQNIIYADLLTSSRTKNYDGSFPLDGSGQLELWMNDKGLKEQMFLALTKMEANEDKENSETIGKHTHDEFGRSNLAKNELKFMEAYFDMKNRGPEEMDIFFVTHGIDFLHFHNYEEGNKKMEVEVDEEEEEDNDEIVEVKEKKKPTIDVQQKNQSDRERFEELMEKRVEEKLAGELAKLKMSIVRFSKELREKTIKIPVLTEKEDKKRKEKEEMEKQKENKKKAANSSAANTLLQRVDSMREGVQTINRGLKNWSKLAAKILKSGKQIRQFEVKKLEECSEDELEEAFKHAIDVLASIVKPKSFFVPDANDFLFHKKATATEARLLAILSHLFTSSRIIPKLDKFMASKFRRVLVPVPTDNGIISVGQGLIGHRRPEHEWVTKLIFNNENVEILAEYFEMRRSKLGLNLYILDELKARPWSLKPLMMSQQKYTGPYSFKTNSMELLPQWAEHNWPEPQTIEKIPLDEKTAGPDHKILTTISAKIATDYWENLRGKNNFDGEFTNYSATRKGLMHIVASYLCKGSIKLKKDTTKLSINFKKEKECSKWHMEQFYKLDEFKRQLLGPIFISMKRIISQIVEETIGFEDKILGAIKKGMNAQENGKKGKGKLDEPVEGNFMLDLF